MLDRDDRNMPQTSKIAPVEGVGLQRGVRLQHNLSFHRWFIESLDYL